MLVDDDDDDNSEEVQNVEVEEGIAEKLKECLSGLSVAENEHDPRTGLPVGLQQEWVEREIFAQSTHQFRGPDTG